VDGLECASNYKTSDEIKYVCNSIKIVTQKTIKLGKEYAYKFEEE
jgi:hypothetical protein